MNKTQTEQKKTYNSNILNVLLDSLKYKLKELDSVNKNIDNLKTEQKGGLYQGEK